MAPKRTPVLNGLLLGGVAALTACGGSAEQFKMGMLAIQASPPAAPPPTAFAPPPQRAFDPPPPREAPPPEPDFDEEPPPPPPPPPVQISNSRAEVRGERIEIREQVQFDTWKSTLRRTSYALLDDIAAVLKQNPQVRRVEIQGHTSITRRNRERLGPLSQRRANAVRDYLIEQGVEPDRLVARGYGYKRPVADNSTPTGRKRNRRVEFVILEQGAAAAATGLAPVPTRSAPPPPPSSGDNLDDFGDDDFGDDDFDDEEDF